MRSPAMSLRYLVYLSLVPVMPCSSTQTGRLNINNHEPAEQNEEQDVNRIDHAQTTKHVQLPRFTFHHVLPGMGHAAGSVKAAAAMSSDRRRSAGSNMSHTSMNSSASVACASAARPERTLSGPPMTAAARNSLMATRS